ncbi:MAG: TfuA-like protein [Pseudomonadota bacterium]
MTTGAPLPVEKTATLPIIVFIGPSRPKGGLPGDLDCLICPPAAQGDLAACVLDHGPCIIALIDGVFQGQPAVRHKEILWAISRGARVYGAASMGALRAAEMAPSGMLGLGLAYRWYRRFPLTPDDAVAVLHAPADLGSVPLTEALLDMRMTLKALQRSGVIGRLDADKLAGIAAAMPYPERTWPALLARAGGLDMALTQAEIDRHRVTAKADDAARLLHHLRDMQHSGQWPDMVPSPPFEMTTAFADDLADAGFQLQDFLSV